MSVHKEEDSNYFKNHRPENVLSTVNNYKNHLLVSRNKLEHNVFQNRE